MDRNVILIGFSVFCIMVSVPFLVGALYYLSCYLGFRNGKTDIVYGELVESEYRKNIYTRRGRKWYKHYTNFEYKYKVDGNEYIVSEGSPLRPHNLSRIEKIIYLPNNPKRAYLPKYTDYRDDIPLVIVLFVIFVMFFLSGLLLLVL